MGALQKIRSKSTLLVGVIAVGLLAFVIPWGEITQFLNISKDRAFVVNGDVVKTGQYSKRIEEREYFEKMRRQTTSLDEMTTSQIREEVYQQMVKERLLDEEAEKLGLAVTNEEMRDMVYSTDMKNLSPILFQIPIFADQSGRFNRFALENFLTQINQNPTNLDDRAKSELLEAQALWSFIENWMKYIRLEEKYSSLVAGSLLTNNAEAKAHFEDSKNVANIAYVGEAYSTIEDSSIEITDAELQSLYNTRKENFFSKQPTRKMSYFVKEVLPSDADYTVVKDEIENVAEKFKVTTDPAGLVSEYSSTPYIDAYLSDNTLAMVGGMHANELKKFIQTASIGDIQGPVRNGQAYVMYKYVANKVGADSISIQMLPVQGMDPVQTAHLADSLINVVKQGKDFASLARELYPTAPNAGDEEWVIEAMLSSVGIGDQCFAAAKGDILNLNVGGQTTLIKIADKTKPVSKYKIAIIEMPVMISEKTQNSIDNELNKFLSENSNVENFAEAARNAGYDIVEDAMITPTDFGLGQLPATRQVVNWSFNEKIGTIKKFEMSDRRIIAVITGEEPAGHVPYNNKEVNTYLRSEILKDKKAIQIIEKMKSKNISSLQALATDLDSKVDSAKFVTFQTNSIASLGYEPVMNVYSKVGKTNTVTGPVKGTNGVYLLEVANRTEDNADFDQEQIRTTLQRNNEYVLFNQAATVLMEKMKVEDNRVKFY